MKISPYIAFDGNGAEAMTYYAQVLGGEIVSSMKFGEMPDQPDWINDSNRERLAHATLKVGDNLIMFSDTAGFEPHKGFAGITIQMAVNSFDEGKALFDKISADGEVRMPYSETFWSKGFGMCHDKYGVGWMVNCDA